MHRRIVVPLIAVVLAVAVGGCGSETKVADEAPPPETTSGYAPKPSKPVPIPDPPSGQHRQGPGSSAAAASAPEPTRHHRPSRSPAYSESRELCALFSASEVAAEYGGNPADPASVAQAYAETSYQPAFQADAEVGCLEGFK